MLPTETDCRDGHRQDGDREADQETVRPEIQPDFVNAGRDDEARESHIDWIDRCGNPVH